MLRNMRHSMSQGNGRNAVSHRISLSGRAQLDNALLYIFFLHKKKLLFYYIIMLFHSLKLTKLIL